MTQLRTQLDGATNIMLEEPPIGQGRDVCSSLLLDEESSPSVLFVSFTRTAADCIEQLSGESISDVGVITVGDASSSVPNDSVITENVSTPSDLTGLGINIGQFLSNWNGPVYICFESLTSMLQYVDFQTAYEFLHAITGQIFAAGARAHFHIDPSAHDEKDLAAILSLFDAKVSLQEDGDYTVRKRKLMQ